MSTAARSRTRVRLLRALKLVAALAILALVVRMVPWRDELRHESEARSARWSGAIDGEWKAERIRFVFDAPQARAALPEAWRAADGPAMVASLAVERGPETSWQPGMPRVFREVRPSGLLVALALLTAGIVATATRWWRLLGAAGCPSRWWNVLRLTFIGFFFNIVVPGLTGGDLVKAVMVAREHPERRAAAAMSVLVDRLIGVLVLALMGAITIVLQGERFADLRTPILVGLALALAAALAYSSRSLRAAIGFERLLARLPLAGTLRQIDEAATVYARHPLELLLAILISLANQGCVIGAIATLGHAFGETALSFAQYIVVASVGNIASAVPLTPGGVGVTEFLYAQLFAKLGGSATIGFAACIAWRLCMVTIGLFGGVFLLLPGGQMSASERAQLAAPAP